MPYVRRNCSGNILSIAQCQDLLHAEFISPTHTEIIDFLARDMEEDPTKKTLSESDLDFARVTEDLIDLLIKKNIILFTELPVEVQAKISGRAKLRSKLSGEDGFLDSNELL